MSLMRAQVDGAGHVTHRSPADLLYFVREQQGTNAIDGPQFHLSLQAMSGGMARRGRFSESAADLIPTERATDEASGHDDLVARFRSLFPDGVVYDVGNPAGGKHLRTLDDHLVARILPTLLAEQDDGSNLVTVSDRRVTPIYHSGELRLILILPAAPEPERIRSWTNIFSAWNAHE